jgi:2-polyprenyl-3-methyl-5-hydroxy-6-metoxy-1,4-benzoquinol methylase
MNYDSDAEKSQGETPDSLISSIATQAVFDQLAGNGRRGQMHAEGDADIESHSIEKKNIQLFVERAKDVAHKTGNKRVLVAGCGDGFETELLAKSGFDVTAFDFSPNMVDVTKRLVPEADVLVGDVTKLNETGIEGPFAGVFLGHVAQFIEDNAMVAKSLSDLSKLTPEGVLFLSTTYYEDPTYMKEWNANGESIGSTIYYHKSPDFLTHTLKNNGFSNIHHEHFDAGAGENKNDYFIAERTHTEA